MRCGSSASSESAAVTTRQSVNSSSRANPLKRTPPDAESPLRRSRHGGFVNENRLLDVRHPDETIANLAGACRGDDTLKNCRDHGIIGDDFDSYLGHIIGQLLADVVHGVLSGGAESLDLGDRHAGKTGEVA